MKKSLLCALAVVPMIWTGCSREHDPSVLATVGASEIRVNDLQAEISRRRALPASFDRNAVLQEMILRRALLATALQLGLDRNPDVVRACENVLIARLKESELQPRLEKISVS